jgi:hypothetical protein
MNINLVLDTKEFDKFAKQFPVVVIKEINEAIQKSAYKIESESKKEAPANSGKLRQMITTSLSFLKGVISANAIYSIYVHEGTRAHTIVPVKKKVLANRRKGIIFGKKVKHPGTKPNRFMVRAVNNSKNTIERYFKVALDNTIKEAVK